MNREVGVSLGGVTLAAVAAAALPFIGNDYFVGIGFTLLTWIALTEAWMLISGMAGYVSLGHVVFYGLGAYFVVGVFVVFMRSRSKAEFASIRKALEETAMAPGSAMDSGSSPILPPGSAAASA